MGNVLKTPPDYSPPQSVGEALARKAELGVQVELIQTQLGDRNRVGPDGRRLSDQEFWQWHHRAKIARTWKVQEIALLKDYLREHWSGTPGARVRRGEASLLILRCLRALLTDTPPEDCAGLVAELDGLLARDEESGTEDDCRLIAKKKEPHP